MADFFSACRSYKFANLAAWLQRVAPAFSEAKQRALAALVSSGDESNPESHATRCDAVVPSWINPNCQTGHKHGTCGAIRYWPSVVLFQRESLGLLNAIHKVQHLGSQACKRWSSSAQRSCSVGPPEKPWHWKTSEHRRWWHRWTLERCDDRTLWLWLTVCHGSHGPWK